MEYAYSCHLWYYGIYRILPITHNNIQPKMASTIQRISKSIGTKCQGSKWKWTKLAKCQEKDTVSQKAEYGTVWAQVWTGYGNCISGKEVPTIGQVKNKKI